MAKLEDLYIVKHHFKAGGIFHPAGTVLELKEVEGIRLYQIRLREGTITRLDLPKDRLNNLLAYISGKYGVDAVANVKAALAKGTVSAEPKAKATTPQPGTKTVATKAAAKTTK